MSGKRLLDAALFFNATRRIAKKHAAIRADQFNVWQKTSTIAKSIENQTDRVTVTLQAASALYGRFNETGPSWDQTTPDYQAPAQPGTQRPADRGTKESLAPNVDSRIEQSTASFDSAAGTKLAQPDASPSQPTSSYYDAIQSRAKTENAVAQSSQDEESPPEGIDLGIFHSSKIAKQLGGMNVRSDIGLANTERRTSFDEDAQAMRDRVERKISTPKPRSSNRPASPPIQSQHTEQQELSKNEQSIPVASANANEDASTLGADIAKEIQDPAENQKPAASEIATSPMNGEAVSEQHIPYQMRSSKVPSSRIGRIWQYAGLGTSMAFGAVGESFRRVTGSGNEGPLMLSGRNMDRLVAKLSRMRGAALKLGQMMSFQDSKMLPQPIHDVLQRVQDNADYMPPSQRDKVLSSNLGSSWNELFAEFEDVPLAAASIGQVHHATLAGDGSEVAVKIQYPGVRASIDSDLSNLGLLLTASRLLPRGLYLDKTIANARTELAWECDYQREAECQTRFRELLKDDQATYFVPQVISEASGDQVLTAEFCHGTAVTKSSLHLDQQEKDWIGTQIMRLCLRELMEFGFMQTDPNWTNFLYNRSPATSGSGPRGSKLELLDYGASRDFPSKFTTPYIQNLIAASEKDGKTVRDLSVQLGYLTGHESKTMVDAHVNSVLTLAEPFMQDGPETYDFRDQTITDRVRAQIPVMLKERLAPPPEETYSLHRKLSGAFLLLARLGARANCKKMFQEAVDGWKARGKKTGSEAQASST